MLERSTGRSTTVRAELILFYLNALRLGGKRTGRSCSQLRMRAVQLGTSLQGDKVEHQQLG